MYVHYFPAASSRVRVPWTREHAFTIDNLLSDDECQRLIALSEHYPYEQSMVNLGGEQVLDTQYRNSARWMVDSKEAVALLWSRLALCPEIFATKELFEPPMQQPTEWRAVGLNPRLRFLRYSPGDYFAPHQDGSFTCEKTQQKSFMTVMLYLNTPESGGETNFLRSQSDQMERVSVQPETGSALIFDHAMTHEGALLKEGVKYAVRTDVMFERA